MRPRRSFKWIHSMPSKEFEQLHIVLTHLTDRLWQCQVNRYTIEFFVEDAAEEALSRISVDFAQATTGVLHFRQVGQNLFQWAGQPDYLR